LGSVAVGVAAEGCRPWAVVVGARHCGCWVVWWN
jgi:hypothetical protein